MPLKQQQIHHINVSDEAWVLHWPPADGWSMAPVDATLTIKCNRYRGWWKIGYSSLKDWCVILVELNPCSHLSAAGSCVCVCVRVKETERQRERMVGVVLVTSWNSIGSFDYHNGSLGQHSYQGPYSSYLDDLDVERTFQNRNNWATAHRFACIDVQYVFKYCMYLCMSVFVRECAVNSSCHWLESLREKCRFSRHSRPS